MNANIPISSLFENLTWPMYSPEPVEDAECVNENAYTAEQYLEEYGNPRIKTLSSCDRINASWSELFANAVRSIDVPDTIYASFVKSHPEVKEETPEHVKEHSREVWSNYLNHLNRTY